MKRIPLEVVSVVFVVLCGTQLLHAQQAAQARKTSGIFTMYTLDPLARTLCLNDGKEGMTTANNNWANRCSDLSYSPAGGGSLVAGIEMNRVAAIVDLGTGNDLRERYEFEDAENGGVGFASLRLEGDKIMILKEEDAKATGPEWQPLKEGPQLFSEARASANAPIKLGHIYLVRIADTKDKNFQQIAKLMVIAYRPEESVTLRWELLSK